MSVDPEASGDRVDSYALVAYIPEPLAGFLNRLRRELVPSCFLKAHVTILPPRRLPSTAEAAWLQVRETAVSLSPFDLVLDRVDIFPVTNVIHIGIRTGGDQLRAMHAELNRAELWFSEPFLYHPHVTLAQDLPPEQVERKYELARRRWAGLPHSPGLRVQTLTFVQNTSRNVWSDLGACDLGLAKHL